MFGKIQIDLIIMQKMIQFLQKLQKDIKKMKNFYLNSKKRETEYWQVIPIKKLLKYIKDKLDCINKNFCKIVQKAMQKLKMNLSDLKINLIFIYKND